MHHDVIYGFFSPSTQVTAIRPSHVRTVFFANSHRITLTLIGQRIPQIFFACFNQHCANRYADLTEKMLDGSHLHNRSANWILTTTLLASLTMSTLSVSEIVAAFRSFSSRLAIVQFSVVQALQRVVGWRRCKCEILQARFVRAAFTCFNTVTTTVLITSVCCCCTCIILRSASVISTASIELVRDC